MHWITYDFITWTNLRHKRFSNFDNVMGMLSSGLTVWCSAAASALHTTTSKRTISRAAVSWNTVLGHGLRYDSTLTSAALACTTYPIATVTCSIDYENSTFANDG